MSLAFKDPTLHWYGLHSEQSLSAPSGWDLFCPWGFWSLKGTLYQSLLGISPWYPCLTMVKVLTMLARAELLKCRVGRTDLVRRTLLALLIQQMGQEVGDVWAKNAPRRSKGICSGNLPLWQGMRVGLPPLPYANFCLHRLEGLHRLERLPTRSSCHSWLQLTDSSCYQRQLMHAPVWVNKCAPSRGCFSSCLGREQTPDSGAHVEVGSKPKLGPRGSETKEEQKSFYVSAQVMG